mmetsp:Transcript_88629/g.198214  ORF Transcript_88629/g.198214 Transcript_88629/m.198214 type:complete len:272 (+) Transcript_88629:247-1062(+)
MTSTSTAVTSASAAARGMTSASTAARGTTSGSAAERDATAPPAPLALLSGEGCCSPPEGDADPGLPSAFARASPEVPGTASAGEASCTRAGALTWSAVASLLHEALDSTSPEGPPLVEGTGDVLAGTKAEGARSSDCAAGGAGKHEKSATHSGATMARAGSGVLPALRPDRTRAALVAMSGGASPTVRKRSTSPARTSAMGRSPGSRASNLWTHLTTAGAYTASASGGSWKRAWIFASAESIGKGCLPVKAAKRTQPRAKMSTLGPIGQRK